MRIENGFLLALAIVASCTGCQNWSSMQGLPTYNPTRIPPPGTGTFQTPSGYYNNTSIPGGAPTSTGSNQKPAATGNPITFRPAGTASGSTLEDAPAPNGTFTATRQSPGSSSVKFASGSSADLTNQNIPAVYTDANSKLPQLPNTASASISDGQK